MNAEERIIEKLEQLTAEVAALKAANGNGKGNGNGALAAQPAAAPAPVVGTEEAQAELAEQLAHSSESLTKLLRSLDQMMELKEDLVPLGKPMVEELIHSLDQITRGFDKDDLKELVKQLALNMGNLAELVRVAGQLVELKEDSRFIVKDAFEDAIIRLEELKQKGFFDAMGQLLQMGELVGQRLLALDTANIKPVKGITGLYGAMKRPEVQQGLGIALELLAALSVLRQR